ncbi:DUF4919 domain-containing protein [Salibacter halophilus]|uniref:DUF4919 domain-containing protein n=1 Tax=Salibacter halophilus TaxID=1803916 RepID=A0A6N6MAV4_9FLAO|nr:DUF4919 domain-containing protein [Salibacter halophilus]KAB1065561.1 DUF4919 domain-containing protein [Salibacter halophilus]
MKRLLFLTIIIIIGLDGFSQKKDFKKPNYQKIEKNISKEESSLFYDSLMLRFQSGDTTLSLKEKRHIYYGYTFQDEYSPYPFSVFNDSIRSIRQKEELTEDDNLKIIQLADSSLMSNPFDLRAIYYQLHSLRDLEMKDKYNKRLTQHNSVIDAILSSGDGYEMKTSFYVITPSHEYVILNIVDLDFGGKQSLIEHYDYLTVEQNKYGIEGLYFDVSPCLNAVSSMFKDEDNIEEEKKNQDKEDNQKKENASDLNESISPE